MFAKTFEKEERVCGGLRMGIANRPTAESPRPKVIQSACTAFKITTDTLTPGNALSIGGV